MTIDGVKKKLLDYQVDLVASRGCCETVDFQEELQFVLNELVQKDAELTKATEIIKFQVERNDKQRKNYFEQEAIILQVEKTLKLIANGNNDFPTWADTVDVLKDVRLVAKEELNLFFRGN